MGTQNFFSLSHARDKTKKKRFSLFLYRAQNYHLLQFLQFLFFSFWTFKEEHRHCTNFIKKLLLKIHPGP